MPAIEFIDYVNRKGDDTVVLERQMDETVGLLPYPLLPSYSRKQGLRTAVFGMVPLVPQILSIGASRNDRLAILNSGPGHLGANAWHFLRCRGRKAAYLCDVWPSKDKLLIKLCRQLGIDPVFVSYRDSAMRLAELDKSRRYIYVPEGLPAGHYPAKPFSERNWELVSFGRKWVALHNQLKEGSFKYAFRDDGTPVANTHDDLMALLGDTKISICAPRGITDPGDTGGVEAMTLRFLQSIACKCLILGRAPGEMVDLFGYNPVVEAREDDPVGQVQQILANFGDYEPLIERNYQELLSRHLWSHRLVEIARILKDDFGWDIVQPTFTPPLSLDQGELRGG